MLSLLVWAVLAVPGSSEGEASATQVDNFRLPAADGNEIALLAPGVDFLATVVVSLRTDCVRSRHYADKVAELDEAYREENVRFLAIAADPETDAGALQAFADEHGLAFPLLMDPLHYVHERLGLARTTSVAMVDADGTLLYRGDIDAGFGEDGPTRVEHDYLLDAIEAIIMEDDVEVETTELQGGDLGEVSLVPTFHEDIAPILYRTCVDCHREGQIGPMSLIDIDDAQGWAPMIAEVVEEGRMPPWNANPRYGKFQNARVLSDHEKALILRWADRGAPAGDPAVAPAVPEFADGEWSMGEPDAVYQLPEPQSVPAEGVIPYRYMTLDPGFEEDVWVEGIEVRPTAPDVTHHVICYLLPPGRTVRGFLNSPDVLGDSLLAGYAPGNRPEVYKPGVAKLIPAGTRFLFEVHYTAVGTPATDQSRMALRFAKGPVTHRVRTTAILNLRLNIEPGDPAATYHARHRLREDVNLIALTPHMHARGKSFRFELVGAETDMVLLDVPRYDFNWQHTYYLEQPMRLSGGDTVYVTAVYDNSEDNPFNPDPSATVRWGDQTWDEMMIGWLICLEELTAP